VIVDLEDAVSPDRKQAARDGLETRAVVARPRGGLVVRINALDTQHADADLEVVRRCPGIDGVLIPKARAAQLADRPTTHPIIALIETSAAILEAPAIATSPGVVRLMLGTVDLAAELGIEITPRSPVFQHARSVLVLTSAAAGLPGPIDGVWTRLHDEAGLRDEAMIAKSAGFTGSGLCPSVPLGV
jgi:citrate lyase subunit beta/citryl-CoA lyase